MQQLTIMSDSTRTQAISAIASVPAGTPGESAPVNIDYYGADVFSTEVMKKYLPKDTAKTLLSTIQDGLPLDADIAADVAHAMKQWAIERGATHYTHWFQPMTGSTAEKHDSFLDPKGMEPVMSFSGKNLIVSEPDASSFPSGGLRCTFEARGYTAWDPTSPAFIKRHGNGATLCIPTAYCSYTGDALDKKTPLLRSRQALGNATKRLMKCFNLPDAHVTITLGPEQEYFLIDKNFYLNRPDLVQTGRTLFGAPPAKHQQLEDHYFGSIKPRILNFMSDVEKELWRLGIPAKTRHNEVAPAQFELAPLFEDVNLAVDHNMLVMEVLRKTANKHDLVCLLHEKPFAGMNGSGKHNNWSLSAPGYGSLLNPGSSPQENAIFLTLLCATIKAVDEHADLLRASVAKSGNEHRLGAHEAPPAIISIFLGDLLDEIIEQIEKGGTKKACTVKTMSIGVDTLPMFPLDTSDRNRTSPFAFTGNKFEFRAVGSSQTCAWPMTVLNTIVAESLDEICTILEPVKDKPEEFHTTLNKLLQDIIKKHKRILFSGDGYGEAWIKEAERRKLANTPGTIEALAALETPKARALFEKYKVVSPVELHARHEIQSEIFHKEINIEAETALLMVETLYIPAVTEQLTQLTSAIAQMKASGIKAGMKATTDRANRIGELLDLLPAQVEALRLAVDKESTKDILTGMNDLRKTIDTLEGLTDADLWPVPTYAELLFL